VKDGFAFLIDGERGGGAKQESGDGGVVSKPGEPASVVTPPAVVPPTTTTTEPTTLKPTNHDFDPYWGKHWSSGKYLDYYDVISLHDTFTASVDSVPESTLQVFDLQEDAVNAGKVLFTEDGNCPPTTTAYKCCPPFSPQTIWGNDRNPVIAISTGVTTRNIKDEDLHPGHLALFQRLMPTIINTYDCDVDYLLVMGFDKGDRFYDTPEGQLEIESWLEEKMAIPFAEAGVRIKFLFVEVTNGLQKPGPVFNSMLQQGYRAGADYFYR